jgi:hypothetical protein
VTRDANVAALAANQTMFASNLVAFAALQTAFDSRHAPDAAHSRRGFIVPPRLLVISRVC